MPTFPPRSRQQNAASNSADYLSSSAKGFGRVGGGPTSSLASALSFLLRTTPAAETMYLPGGTEGIEKVAALVGSHRR